MREARFLYPAALGAFTFLLGLPGQARAGKYDDVVKAFQDNARYVEPVATLFGSLTNSGWYQSAGVSSLFGFYLGLPISLVNIADADRTYSATFSDDGCRLYHADQDNPGAGGSDCPVEVSYKAPTLFGRNSASPNMQTVYNPNSNQIVDTLEFPVSDGLWDVAKYNWFPFLMPQLSANFFHTEVKLRYFILPLGDISFQTFGIGLQHDLSSFLPPLPVSISLAGNLSTLGFEWSPGDDIDGTLELGGLSQFYGLLVGYNFLGMMEVFAEAGWEMASIESGGTLVIHDPDGNDPDETVKPALDVDGRNGFRAALNFAFHFGYQAVVGQNLGANVGNQISLAGFRLKL